MAKIDIYRRGENWYLKYPDPITGRRRFRSLGTSNIEEAYDLCAKYRIEIKTRTEGGVPDYPLIDALLRWKKEHLPKLVYPEGYKSHYKSLLPFLDGRQLSEIVEVAKAITEASESRGLVQSTINQRLSILKKVASLAYRKWEPKWLDRSLSELIELPKPDNIRNVLLSEDEVYQLVGAIDHPETKAYTLFMAFTGLRRAEARRIHPDDVRETSHGPELTIAGKCGIRTIPLQPDQVEFVRQYTPLAHHPSYYYKYFRKGVKKLKWGDVRMHDLRHFCATWMLSNNTDHKIIMSWLGHTTTAMLDRYLCLTSTMLRNATPTRAMDKVQQTQLKLIK